MATAEKETTDQTEEDIEVADPTEIDFGSMYAGDESEDEQTSMEDLHEVDNPDEESEETKEEVEEDTSEEKSEDETKSTEEEQEETEEEEEESEVRVVDYIAEEQGYDVETEDLDDTPDGIKELTDRIADRKAEKSLNRVAQKDEAMGELLQFIDAGGSVDEFVDTYYNSTDYSEIDLEEAGTREKREVVRDKLRNIDNANYSDEEVEEILDDYEESGLLDKQAERAKDKLAEFQESQKEDLVEKQKQRQQEVQEEIQEFWNDVENTINESNQFAGIDIPESEKDDFFEFISEPVDEQGRSKRDKVVEEAPLEVRLAIDYLLYQDFDLSKVAERINMTEQAEHIEKKLGAVREDLKDKSANSSSSSEEENASQGDEVDLGGLMQ